MMDAELASWLKLNEISGLGNEGILNLLSAFGSPASVLMTPVSSLVQFVSPKVANSIASCSEPESLAGIANWLDDPLNHIVTLADAEYPKALLNIPDPPVLLY